MKNLTRPQLAAAIHESGHAAVAIALGQRVRTITVSGEGEGLVRCYCRTPQSRLAIGREIFVCLAGPIAEGLFLGTFDAQGSLIDFRMAAAWARELGAKPADALPKFAEGLAQSIRQPAVKRAIWALAVQLLKRGQLAGAEVESICRTLNVRGKVGKLWQVR